MSLWRSWRRIAEMGRKLKNQSARIIPTVEVCPVCQEQILSYGNPLPKLMRHVDRRHPKHCYCGKLLATHPHCHACGIYTGSGHLESELFERLFRRIKHTLCKDCTAFFDRVPKKIILQHPENFKGPDYHGIRELLVFRCARRINSHYAT